MTQLGYKFGAQIQNSKCKINVYLKSNTVCYNLGFILTKVTINILQSIKDNLLLLICVCLHEFIFDRLDVRP